MQSEAPLLIRPFISKMTRSELHAICTGGFATIAGSVMAAYILYKVQQHTHQMNKSQQRCFKRYPLMNATYFFGNNLFHFGVFWQSLGKLAHTNTTSTNGGIQYINYMRFKIVYFFMLYFKNFYVVYE